MSEVGWTLELIWGWEVPSQISFASPGNCIQVLGPRPQNGERCAIQIQRSMGSKLEWMPSRAQNTG